MQTSIRRAATGSSGNTAGGRACRRRLRPVVAAAIAATAGLSSTGGRRAHAAVQFWDAAGATGNLGGTGTWDSPANTSSMTGTPNWTNTAGSATTTTWVNGNDANFNGTAGTVTVDPTGVGAGNLLFSVNGYTLAGGPLVLNGSSPVVNESAAAAGTTTISAALAGTAGVTYNGSGYTTTTFALTGGTSTYTGTTVVGRSTLNFTTLANDGAASSFGTSGTVQVGGGPYTASNVTVNYVGTAAAATNRLWTFGPAGNGTTTLANNGFGPLSFTNTGAAVVGTASNRIIALGGVYTASANTFAESLADTTGFTTTLKITGGQWLLTGTGSTYSGPTNVSSATTVAGIGAHAFGSTASIGLTATSFLSLLGDASTTFSTAANSTPYAVLTTGNGSTINADEATSAGATVAKTMTIGTLATSSTSTTLAYKFTGADDTGIATGAVTGPVTAGAGSVVINNGIPTTTGSVTLASYTSLNAAGGETLNIGNLGNTTVTGAITPSKTTLSLLKTGAGTLSLLGGSSYTGGTSITSGTVFVGPAGNLGTAGTTISGVGVLAGTGTVTTSVVVASGGAVTAGSGGTVNDSTGVFTTGTQTWNSSGAYIAKVTAGAGSANDTLVLSGGLFVNATPTAPFNVSLTSTGTTTLAAGQQLLLAFIPGAAQGAFNTSSLVLTPTNVTSPNGLVLADTTGLYNGVAGDELLAEDNTAAAPEPASLALLAVAAGPLLVGRRRRAAPIA